tara:strand:+ start:4941 stop:5372 length:432 start_codon:yes stop_codon:yes gene_type:complete
MTSTLPLCESSEDENTCWTQDNVKSACPSISGRKLDCMFTTGLGLDYDLNTCEFSNDDDADNVRKCVSPTLSQRSALFISLIALVPEILIIFLLLLVVYLKQKQSLLGKVWMDAVALLILLPLAYGINYGVLQLGLYVDKKMT